MSVNCQKDLSIVIGIFEWFLIKGQGYPDTSTGCSGVMIPNISADGNTPIGTDLDVSVTCNCNQAAGSGCPIIICGVTIASAFFFSNTLGPFPVDRSVRLVGTATLRCAGITITNPDLGCEPESAAIDSQLNFFYRFNGIGVGGFNYTVTPATSPTVFAIDETVLLPAGTTFRWGTGGNSIYAGGLATSEVNVRSYLAPPP